MTTVTLIPLITLLALAPLSGAAEEAAAPALSARQRAEHALNRLAFGPRPGDIDRILESGLDRWIHEQIHPEGIRDSGIDAILARYPTLRMSSAELFDTYEKPLLDARRSLKTAAARDDAKAMTEREKRAMRQEALGGIDPRQPLLELTAQRILRAVASERQLDEVMADFWMNHFNVFGRKGPTGVLLTSFERDTIRPNMWGRFEELLLATAKSPAMLVYLDNVRSIADAEHRPSSARSRGTSPGGARMRAERSKLSREGGLNENYARELMELHTLGVDGGYTQADVTELARVLTGWSIRRLDDGGGFVFRGDLHDAGSKTVLGVTLPARGGIEEGERMIRALAGHPATAHHIARALCQRLVADEPPAGLVQRVASVFLGTRGDLRKTVEAVVTSPEFFDPAHYRAKVKTPFEYVVSAVRGLGGVTDARFPGRSLVELGEPLYLCQPPTGYSDLAEDWVSSGALVERLNFALALAAGQTPGTTVHLESILAGSADPIDRLADSLLGGELSASTRKAIDDRVASEPLNVEQRTRLVAGLILGSPEFQRQ